MTELADLLDWKAFLDQHIDDYPEPFKRFMTEFLLCEASMGRGATGYAYRNYYELVRRHGTLRQQAFIIPDDPTFESMELGQCYYNSFNGAVELGLQYVEGYAMTDLTVVPHAWLEDEEGTIIDATWAKLGLPIDFQVTYFGVKFERDFVIERADATDHCAVLGSDYLVHSPILRFGLTFKDDIAVGLA